MSEKLSRLQTEVTRLQTELYFSRKGRDVLRKCLHNMEYQVDKRDDRIRELEEGIEKHRKTWYGNLEDNPDVDESDAELYKLLKGGDAL